MYQLQEWIQEISGFHKVSLTPAAGAHGELVGALIIKKYHEDNNETQRVKILIPDSAHGTNPATSSMSGFVVVPLPSDERGNVDLDALKSNCDETLAGLMLTNPNTLGLFDENVVEVIEMVHTAGGLVYGDGANLNALLGILRPGDVGFDIMHFNLHKTFQHRTVAVDQVLAQWAYQKVWQNICPVQSLPSSMRAMRKIRLSMACTCQRNQSAG